MKYRPLITFALLLAIITLPYWIYLPALFAAIVILPVFWEGIILGFIIDILYGPGSRLLPSAGSFYGLCALLLIIILIPVRERLRTHV